MKVKQATANLKLAVIVAAILFLVARPLPADAVSPWIYAISVYVSPPAQNFDLNISDDGNTTAWIHTQFKAPLNQLYPETETTYIVLAFAPFTDSFIVLKTDSPDGSETPPLKLVLSGDGKHVFWSTQLQPTEPIILLSGESLPPYKPKTRVHHASIVDKHIQGAEVVSDFSFSSFPNFVVNTNGTAVVLLVAEPDPEKGTQSGYTIWSAIEGAFFKDGKWVADHKITEHSPGYSVLPALTIGGRSLLFNAVSPGWFGSRTERLLATRNPDGSWNRQQIKLPENANPCGLSDDGSAVLFVQHSKQALWSFSVASGESTAIPDAAYDSHAVCWSAGSWKTSAAAKQPMPEPGDAGYEDFKASCSGAAVFTQPGSELKFLNKVYYVSAAGEKPFELTKELDRLVRSH